MDQSVPLSWTVFHADASKTLTLGRHLKVEGDRMSTVYRGFLEEVAVCTPYLQCWFIDVPFISFGFLRVRGSPLVHGASESAHPERNAAKAEVVPPSSTTTMAGIPTVHPMDPLPEPSPEATKTESGLDCHPSPMPSSVGPSCLVWAWVCTSLQR